MKYANEAVSFFAFGGVHPAPQVNTCHAFLDSDGTRRQVEKTLCEVSDRYRTKKDALPLAKAEVGRLNRPESGGSAQTIAHFVESVYLPFVDEKKRPATANGYHKTWEMYLRDRIGKVRLVEFEPKHAAKLLDALVERGLGRHTVHHVRSLLSAIFKRAIREGLVKWNPIREVTVETPETRETPHYTIKEMQGVLRALANYPQAQLAMALAFIGLRPSEIMALRWEDIGWQENDGETARVLKVQRSYWRGTIAPCKNKNSRRAVALGATVEGLLEKYRQEYPSDSGYILENSLGDPLDLHALSRKVIRPVLAEYGLEWKQYYAGRRGAETEMNRHTQGNSQVTSHHFGHSKEVADAHYVKPIPRETRKAALALDAALAKTILRDKQGMSLTARASK